MNSKEFRAMMQKCNTLIKVNNGQMDAISPKEAI